MDRIIKNGFSQRQGQVIVPSINATAFSNGIHRR